MGDDIPVVSKLAKQTDSQKMANMDGQQQLDYLKKNKREQVNKVIENDEETLETHFVENPYIKIRERASERLKS